MRFSVTALCGGKAQMATSKEVLDINMNKAKDVLDNIGKVKTFDDMMIISSWKDMEITLYPQGKIMFHPLEDRNKAVEYATEILTLIL